MSDITLTFPDGSERAYPEGITGAALAESISKSLAKKAVAIVLDGELTDLADPIRERCRDQDRHPRPTTRRWN